MLRNCTLLLVKNPPQFHHPVLLHQTTLLLLFRNSSMNYNMEFASITFWKRSHNVPTIPVKVHYVEYCCITEPTPNRRASNPSIYRTVFRCVSRQFIAADKNSDKLEYAHLPLHICHRSSEG